MICPEPLTPGRDWVRDIGRPILAADLDRACPESGDVVRGRYGKAEETPHVDEVGDEGLGSVDRRRVGGFLSCSASARMLTGLWRRSDGRGEERNSSIRSVSGTGSIRRERQDSPWAPRSCDVRVRGHSCQQDAVGGRLSEAVRPVTGSVSVSKREECAGFIRRTKGSQCWSRKLGSTVEKTFQPNSVAWRFGDPLQRIRHQCVVVDMEGLNRAMVCYLLAILISFCFGKQAHKEPAVVALTDGVHMDVMGPARLVEIFHVWQWITHAIISTRVPGRKN